MRRRTYLTMLAGGSALLPGCSGFGWNRDDDRPAYLRRNAAYGRPGVTISIEATPVRLGDTVTFEITNDEADSISLGCHVVWALQRRLGGEWRHVVWTGDRFYQLCATTLASGDTIEETVTLTTKALSAYGELHEPLSPGRYRFVLAGTDTPYPTVEFEIRAAT